MSAPAEPWTWRSRLKVKYVCTTDKIVGVTLSVSTALDGGQYGRHFHRIWRCHAQQDKVTLKIRKVRVRVPDDIAFRPSLFNKKSSFVEAARIVAWMVDEITWRKVTERDRDRMHKWALSRKSFQVLVQPPYSRPYKRFPRSCVPWYWTLLQTPKVSDTAVCPVEQCKCWHGLHYLSLRLCSHPPPPSSLSLSLSLSLSHVIISTIATIIFIVIITSASVITIIVIIFSPLPPFVCFVRLYLQVLLYL